MENYYSTNIPVHKQLCVLQLVCVQYIHDRTQSMFHKKQYKPHIWYSERPVYLSKEYF